MSTAPASDVRSSSDVAPIVGDAPVTSTQLVDALRAIAPPRKKTVGDIKINTPFNKTGRPRKFKIQPYTNGYRENVLTTKDAELTLYGQLKPGKYLDGFVTVEMKEIRGEGGEITKQLHIFYPDKGRNDTIAQKDHFRSREEMLRKIIREAGDKPLA